MSINIFAYLFSYSYFLRQRKEDKVFFPADQAYFSGAEQQALLDAFWQFDRKMIHEKYEAVVDGLENQ